LYVGNLRLKISNHLTSCKPIVVEYELSNMIPVNSNVFIPLNKSTMKTFDLEVDLSDIYAYEMLQKLNDASNEQIEINEYTNDLLLKSSYIANSIVKQQKKIDELKLLSSRPDQYLSDVNSAVDNNVISISSSLLPSSSSSSTSDNSSSTSSIVMKLDYSTQDLVAKSIDMHTYLPQEPLNNSIKDEDKMDSNNCIVMPPSVKSSCIHFNRGFIDIGDNKIFESCPGNNWIENSINGILNNSN
jgi:hypothetical protein